MTGFFWYWAAENGRWNRRSIYMSGEYGCGVIGKVVNVTADERVMVDGKIDMSLVNAIAFDPYTHGYYRVTERVGEAFQDGLKLKK